MVAPVSTIESTICQIGGVSTVIRRNISSGVRNGMSDSTVDIVLSGDWSTIGKNITPTTSGMKTGKARLWASWVVLTEAPTAAKSDE